MSNMIKTLMSEFGFLAEDADIERNVKDQLMRASKKDEVDTVAFGLETDDGAIVKVYVNAEHAERFEQEMAKMLGEVDDIEEALNQISKDIEIVDVEWPDDEADSDDDEIDDEENETGSEVLNSKVYSKKNLKKEDEVKEMSYGDELTSDLLSEASNHSIANQLSTVNQHLIYQAILHLGVPDLALDKSPYRSAILRGIKDTAVELAHTPAMRSALKVFIKQQALDDRNNGQDEPVKALSKEKEVKEPSIKDEPKPAQKRQDEPVLKKHVDEPNLKLHSKNKSKAPLKEDIDSPAETYWNTLTTIIKLLDVSEDKSYSERITSSQQFGTLLAKSKSRITSKITSGIRSKIEAFERAIADNQPVNVVTEQFTYVQAKQLVSSMLKLADDPSSDLANRITDSQAFKRLMVASRTAFISINSAIIRTLQALKIEIEKVDLTEANEKDEPPAPDEDEKPDNAGGEPKQTPTAAPAAPPAPVSPDANDSGMTFEAAGDAIKVTYPGGSFELGGEGLERALKALNNKQTLSVQLASGKFATISPRGSSAQIKFMGTETKVMMTPPDISAFLDAGGQVLEGDADNSKPDEKA